MPSPFGEGQADMPISRLHLGEVPQTPLPQGGEAKTSSNKTILGNSSLPSTDQPPSHLGRAGG